MKRRLMPTDLFDKFTLIIATIVILFFLIAISFIIVKGFPHMIEALMQKEILYSVKLSLYTASISTLICIILAIPTSYALTRTNMPLKRLSQLLLELPLSLPYLVLGLSLLLVFSSKVGKLLGANGFQIVFSKKGIIFAHIFVNLPLVIRIIKTSFNEIDIRLETIARLLGASKAQSFWTVTLPLSKQAIVGAIILAWSRALGEFGATLMLVGATRMKTETLPASIYLNMATGDTKSAMSSATILLIIAALTQLLLTRLNSKINNQRLGGFV